MISINWMRNIIVFCWTGSKNKIEPVFLIDKTNDVSIMITNFVSILMRGEIMPRTGLTKEEIIEKAAALANEKGLSYLTVTTLSEYLGIRKPSLYNHIKTIDDLYYKLMIYGWKKVSEEIAVGINSSDPNENLKTFGRSFYKFALENLSFKSGKKHKTLFCDGLENVKFKIGNRKPHTKNKERLIISKFTCDCIFGEN